MYPTLLQIGSFRLDTYSVVWFIALSLAILWSIKRLELYGLDEDESRRIMAVSFIFMLLGSMVFKHLRFIPLYIANPSKIPAFNQWGLSEFGAVLGAFVSAFIMCMFSRKISFLKLCDAASLPSMLAIAVGRWGCFLNGCCVGNRSDFLLAVHFPRDASGVFRHPVQIYYSAFAAVCVLILIFAERKILQAQRENYHSVITPLTIILYTLMRFSVAPLRQTSSLVHLIENYRYTTTYSILAAVFPLACLWLAHSLFRLYTVSSHK